MYDEYGEFRGHVLIYQCEWQIHYFDAHDTKPSSDNDEFHDTLEQFVDDPDSIIEPVLIVHVMFMTMRQWRPLLSLS
jgi:hypothetical protein